MELKVDEEGECLASDRLQLRSLRMTLVSNLGKHSLITLNLIDGVAL